MDIFQSFNVNSASYFAIKLIFFLLSVGFFFFTLIVSRQVQLMNRVLKTPYSGVIKLISGIFIIASVVVAAFLAFPLILS